MSDALPVIYLARHGETAWTISHQHTGRTDLPLTPQGEAEATRLGQRLQGLTFAAVLTSPLRRTSALGARSEEHTSELQSHHDLVCRLLLEKKKKNKSHTTYNTSTYLNS